MYILFIYKPNHLVIVNLLSEQKIAPRSISSANHRPSSAFFAEPIRALALTSSVQRPNGLVNATAIRVGRD